MALAAVMGIRGDGEVVKLVEELPPSECSMCHKTAECRPYGPEGSSICLACGLLDWPNTKARMMVELEARVAFLRTEVKDENPI